MTDGVDVVEVGPVRVVGVARDVTFGGLLGPLIEDLLGVVWDHLPDAPAPGARVIAFTPAEGGTALMLVGCVWDDPTPKGLEEMTLPAGRVARVRHDGPPAAVHEAHVAVHAWLSARDHVVGPHWELHAPGRGGPVEVHYLLRG